eukprot:jgi/Astpho2/2456/Aster-x1078
MWHRLHQHVAREVAEQPSPAKQQAAAHPAQLKAVPLPGIEAGGSSGSSQQQQLPAEGVDSEPGSPGPPAEQAFGNCGALAEQPLSGSTPITGQDTEQGESPCSNRQPNAACTQLGRLTAQQQVQEPGAAPAPLGKAGGTQHGCTELTQGLSANRDEAEAAGRAEETSGRPLAAGWLHSGIQAGTPPAQGVRHNRRVSFAVPVGGGEPKPRPVRPCQSQHVPSQQQSKQPAPSLTLASARELASPRTSAASDASCLGDAAGTDRAQGSLQSPGAVLRGGSPPASNDSPAQGAAERLFLEGPAPSAVSGPLGPRDRNAGTRQQNGSSSLPEPKHAAAAQNMPEPLPLWRAGLPAVHASVQPSPPPSQSLMGCLPAEAGRGSTAETQLLRQQLWTGTHHCSPGGVQLPGVVPHQGKPERLPAAPGGEAAHTAGQAQQRQRSPQPAPKLAPSRWARAATFLNEAEQPQRSPKSAVKPSWAKEATQAAAPARAQNIAEEAALQSPACRVAACSTGCHPGNPQLVEAEQPVPAKLTDTCEAAQAPVPAATEQALSAARDTSRAAHEVTSGGDPSTVREQALSAARDASQAAQLLMPGGASTDAEQLDLDVALFKAAVDQGLSVARPASATSKARATSHAASDEAPAVVEQALNRPHEDGAATLASAELAGSHPRQATLFRTSSSSPASKDLSGSQATWATLPGAGRAGTTQRHSGALPSSCTSDATRRAAHQRRRLLDLPRRVYNIKGKQAKEQLALDPLQQDFRELYINEKLFQRWRRGEAWAALDLQGIALSERGCGTTLVSLPSADQHPVQQLTGLPVHQQAQSQLAAACLHSKQGAEAVQAVRHRVQQEWQQLKRLRQRYMQPALQVNSQQQPFAAKSILRQASGPLKSPQQSIA